MSEVICSFVRQRSDIQRPSKQELEILDADQLPKTSHDIAAAMNVLKRRSRRFGRGEATRLDLKGANLNGLHFSNSDFQAVNLEGALLIGTTFIECNLAHARLCYGDHRYGSMARTILVDANLQHMKANHAHYYYWGVANDLLSDVAEPITDTDRGTTWQLPCARENLAKVEAARYLDSSFWDGADLQGANFECSDLSGMRGLLPAQYESFKKPTGAVPPRFIWTKVKLTADPTLSNE